jgi:hypothetical protein
MMKRTATIMACKICETRRPRRFCPGVGGEICSLCCGTGREETVRCPLDCAYLQEARLHEKHRELDQAQAPYPDVQLTNSFLERNGALATATGQLLLEASLASEATDADVREALDSMVRTLRTLESGLIYESRSPNPFAMRIQEHVKGGIEEFRKQTAERTGMATLRDADVLGILVFFLHMAWRIDNGRRNGRAFVDFLRSSTPLGERPGPVAPEPPGLILS